MKNNNKKTTVKIQKLVLGKINIQSCSLQYKHNNFLPFQEMCQNFKKKDDLKNKGLYTVILKIVVSMYRVFSYNC